MRSIFIVQLFVGFMALPAQEITAQSPTRDAGHSTASPRRAETHISASDVFYHRNILESSGLTDIAPDASLSHTGTSAMAFGGPTFRAESAYWVTTTPGESLLLTWPDPRTIEAVSFGTWFRLDPWMIPAAYAIECSADGASFTAFVPPVTGNANLAPAHFGTCANVRYLRITINAFQPGQNRAYIAGLRVLTATGAAKHGQDLWAVSSGSPNVTLRTTGNVGIGTTTPTQKLHVAGMVAFESAKPWFFDGLGGLSIADTTPMEPAVGAAIALRGAFRTTGATALFAGIKAGKQNGVDNDAAGYLSFFTRSLSAGHPILERLRIDSEGRVGVGTATPSQLLDVGGSARVAADLTVGGTIFGGNITARYQDLAEWVPALDELTAGTVVTLDRARPNTVVASVDAYDSSVAGVVSPQPGIILGEAGDSKALIATTGRVRVRANTAAGPIAIGDLLVTSHTIGEAMKSVPIRVADAEFHRPGTILGKALEPLTSETGEILVLLSLQ
jgi:hypothetical protein